MKNLINFFFSFDKLMKEKLIVPFFWLSIILIALYFSTIFLETIWLGPLAKILNVFTFFAAIVFSLVGVRLLCELMVAVFRINNNLSPDGGKSETADIDPMIEARKAAEAAALRAREVTKSAGEKASAATKTAVEKTKEKTKNVTDSAKDSVSDVAGNAARRTKSAAKATTSAKVVMPKKASNGTAASKQKKTTKSKTTKKPAAKKVSPKTKAQKLDASLYATDKKGNIIYNKDGSPRKKRGRKAKS